MEFAFVLTVATQSPHPTWRGVQTSSPCPARASSFTTTRRPLRTNIFTPIESNFKLSRSENPTILASADVAANPPNILISGAPASGKGTQCEFLVSHYGVVHISTGDMLRAAVKAESQLGLEAKAFMDAGELVPDELVISLLKDRILQDDCRMHGWLLDGFPRTAVQARALSDAGIIPSSVILLDVPDAVLIDRVIGRRLDPETGKIYHVKYNAPVDPAVVARLTRRSDDTEEKVRVRLKNYYTHAQSILEQYAGRVRRINGNRAKEDVFEDLVYVIDEGDDGDSSDDDDFTLTAKFGDVETTTTDSSSPDSTSPLSVSEFVRKAEEAFEEGVIRNQNVTWSGQAGLDTSNSDGTSSYADLSRRLDVAFGDAIAILLFAYIGRSTHGDNAIDLELFKTAAPFLASWFFMSPLLGAYTRPATANVMSTLLSFSRAWAVSVPMGLALRGNLISTPVSLRLL